jgi:hypothetical protein
MRGNLTDRQLVRSGHRRLNRRRRESRVIRLGPARGRGSIPAR